MRIILNCNGNGDDRIFRKIAKKLMCLYVVQSVTFLEDDNLTVWNFTREEIEKGGE